MNVLEKFSVYFFAESFSFFEKVFECVHEVGVFGVFEVDENLFEATSEWLPVWTQHSFRHTVFKSTGRGIGVENKFGTKYRCRFGSLSKRNWFGSSSILWGFDVWN
jgi:hypothetical protein